MRSLLLLVPLALSAQIPEVPGKIVDQATIRYIDITPGAGADAKPGQRYKVHYTGWLRDGTQFDSSSGRDPLEFVQGRREVIAGFDIAFEGMKVGGKRRVFIPYQLAYGEQTRGRITPKSELIFDIELIDTKDVPTVAPAAELLLPFDDMERQVTALALAIPEDKYDWRPGPGVRSFKEVFLHIAYGNHLLLKISDSGFTPETLRKQVEENAAGESAALNKTQVIEKLRESFTTVRTALDALRPAGLNRPAEFFGRTTTKRGVLTVLDVHIAEHLGQAIAYARVNGIVPPWSK